MNPELIVYRKFDDIALANDLTELLKKHEIIYFMEEQSLTVNPALVLNDELATNYVVKINGSDFDLVNQIMLEAESENTDELEKDYYLFDFTNDELIELLSKADEWSAFDIVHARKILAERGVVVSDEKMLELSKKRIIDLKTPEPPQTSWIIIGYLCSLLGGVFGIFIGWHLWSHKKTLPNGEKVFEYNENDRKHGKRIFYLSLVIFVLLFIAKLTGIIFGSNN